MMKRRAFLEKSAATLSWGGVAAGLAPGWARGRETGGGGPGGGREATPEDWVEALARANRKRLPGLLARQETAPGHPWAGGVRSEHGIHNPQETAGLVLALACALARPAGTEAGDRAHATERVGWARALAGAAGYLRRAQHEDGTIDLASTNFASPPDTAFVVEKLAPALTLLNGLPGGGAPTEAVEAAAEAREMVGTFLRGAGEALRTGGIHTPNHRWVVCGALAQIHAMFPNPGLVARVDAWLAEGIDIDPDGQYTEKSTAIYSPVVDRALLQVARLLGRPELLDPVRRNLEMTLYYIHPDGEVVTEASRRQDRYQRGSMARYYLPYRYLARHDGNGQFAALARQIEGLGAETLVDDLSAFLTEPELAGPLPPAEPLPENYEKVFAHSGLVRIRRGRLSATLLEQNTTVLAVRKGAAALEAVRLAGSFFGKGQFQGDKLERVEGGYLLRQRLEGPYFQPLTAEQIAAGEQVRMTPNGTLAAGSRALRAVSNLQTLDTEVRLREREGRLELAFRIVGTERVPVALELGFRRGGTLEGVRPVPGMADAWVLDGGGRGVYRWGEDAIVFGPGRAEHTQVQLRGALPKWDGWSVYLTGFTPCEWSLEIL